MLSGTGTPWKSKLCSHSLGHSSIVFVMSLMMIVDIVLLHCIVCRLSIVLIHLFRTNVVGADVDYLIRFSSSLILCLNSLDS